MKDPAGRNHILIFWKRIVLAIFTLAIVGWCSLAAAAYVFLQQKHGFSDISYLNLVFPHR